MDSSGDEEEVDQELLEWGEAGKIFGLLAGTDEMDEEEQQKTVEGIRLFRQGIVKKIEGLKMQDEGLAIVQEAVAKHPLRALGPLLDAAMVGLREVTTIAAASPGKHVMCTSSAPIPSDPCLSEAGKIFGLLAGTDEMDEEEQQKTVEGIRLFRQGIVKKIEGLKMQDEGLAIVQEAVAKHPLRALGPPFGCSYGGFEGSYHHSCSFSW